MEKIVLCPPIKAIAHSPMQKDQRWTLTRIMANLQMYTPTQMNDLTG
jgi:hypothetical protein